jgi:hypothetical protein
VKEVGNIQTKGSLPLDSSTPPIQRLANYYSNMSSSNGNSNASNTGGTGNNTQPGANTSASRSTGAAAAGTSGPMQSEEQREGMAGFIRNLQDKGATEIVEKAGDSSRKRRGL